MTKDEIINKGLHFYYPIQGKPDNAQKQTDGVKSFNFPNIDLRYDGMNLNSHHFTTEYHNKYVLPLYNKILNIGADFNSWNLGKKIVEQDDLKFDLSYLTPKKNKNFHVRCIGKTCEYDCDFKGLLYNEKVKNITWITPYHELYCLPHLCSIVSNKSENNGKKLLLIGDSQSVPDIPFLSYYFKEVWYIDNRDKIEIANELNKSNFDIVIFAQNINNDKYYYDFIK